MDSDPLVAKLRDEFDRVGEMLEKDPHDPRLLTVAMHEYRLLAEAAIAEVERLQGTIYQFYGERGNRD
jgi:uncharacterized protein YcgL (UPF0745 family)